MDIRVISDEATYRAALAQVSALIDLDPEPGTAEGKRLEFLGTLVQAYEVRHCRIAPPDPIEAELEHPGRLVDRPAGGSGRVNEFTLTKVEVVGAGLLQVAYADGVALPVSVLHIISAHPSLWSLLDPDTFARAAIGEAGASVTWGRDGLALASDTIRALAIGQALD